MSAAPDSDERHRRRTAPICTFVFDCNQLAKTRVSKQAQDNGRKTKYLTENEMTGTF
jgi:hypothetical protein